MNEITRICGQCGKSSPLDAQYCPHCGYDTQGNLPVASSTGLPATLRTVALPLVAGVASLAMRAAWKLLRSRFTHQLAQQAMMTVAARQVQPLKPQVDQTPARRLRRTIRIRSAWTVGDANGTWRQGTSDHTIELED
jgi:predicted amidophosphoribosyltransferase